MAAPSWPRRRPNPPVLVQRRRLLWDKSMPGRTHMPTSKTVQELNRELARKLIEAGRNNPQSPYAGKYIGIANGQVVAVADNWDELARQLRQVEPDPSK